ncbi:hypothetical protein SAMN05192560_0458 [Methylobacillus rhizosphaerae]|uniref:Hemolysin n=1 Tax=Methylobacillus rhizosphaerae TaxID=551994 RepID=A0A238YD80_9PROT|nr:DUF333 domain-containing protein [Methylobacillus rhizosphaerae]SNR68309.1 hypothetical protein SAMN05192560_0458 [Methylobacillus rhizosphaerae]
MKISASNAILLSNMCALLLLSACNSDQEPDLSTGLVNPASEYCIRKGGKLEIVKEEAGEKGMCHLPDGSVVDEWKFFRHEHSAQ